MRGKKMKRSFNIFEKVKQQTVHSGRRRLFIGLLGLLAMSALPSVNAYAETEMYDVKCPVGEGTVTGGISNTEAAEGFIHQALFHDEPAAAGASAHLGDRLTAAEKILYQTMKDHFTAMTTRTTSGSGTSFSTIVEIPAADLIDHFPEKTRYTAEELGVDSIIEVIDGLNYITLEAMDAFYAKVQFNPETVINALAADSPYDFYWFDKTASYYYYFTGLGCDGESLWLDESSNDYFVVELPVAQEYAVSRTGGTTDFDLSFTNAVCNAADTAAGIIETYKNKSDIDKLYAYKNEICDRVDYNDDAAGHPTPYGNPWQVIWVFDGNPDTKVVCEGYSKAFQYLCDLSAFHTPIYTICVSGTMDGGAHMWNIVAMDDGKRYMADVTNSDEGTIGAPNDLFMATYTEYRPGNPLSEYDFNIKGRTITYIYDDRTVSLFRSNELEMTDLLFDPEDYPEANIEGDHDILHLPRGLKVIEEEAFAGINSEMVIVPEGCTAIRGRAFYGCPNLRRVILPASCTDIAPDAFDGCGEVQLSYH